MLPDTASGQIAIETGIRGPNMCIVTACSTGTHNIGEAAEGIRRGDFIAAIAGSTETPLYEVGYIGFSNMRGMGTPRDGRGAARPSRGRSTGRATASCWARASGAMMLEDLEYAKARGARVYAEVVGYGSAADAWDLIQPIEKGDGARRALIQALERHGVPRDEIDLINPHGTSTPLGDLREAQAIWARLRRPHAGHRDQRHQVDDRPPDGCRGRGRGRVHGAAGPPPVRAGDARTTATPTRRSTSTSSSGSSRSMQIRYAMCDNIGLGGHNGAVIFKRYDGD